jgi:hypothetical protein
VAFGKYAAGVIPVHVREHDIRRFRRIDTSLQQCLGWRAQQFAATALRRNRIEAGVHHDGAAVAADREDIEVERIWRRVIVRDDVVLELQAPVEDAVAQCEDLIGDVRFQDHVPLPSCSWEQRATREPNPQQQRLSDISECP